MEQVVEVDILSEHNYTYLEGQITIENHLIDHNYNSPIEDSSDLGSDYNVIIDDGDDEDENIESSSNYDAENMQFNRTYICIPGVHSKSNIYIDNFQYKYYKKSIVRNKMYLIFEKQRNKKVNEYGLATFIIEIHDPENRMKLRPGGHNHGAVERDLDMPYLRRAIGRRATTLSAMSMPIRHIYNKEIVSHPAGSLGYTFQQAQHRCKRMKNCRRPKIPETIPALIQLLNMPEHITYRTTLREPQSDFFQQALTVEGITIGVIFANLDLIAMFHEELRTVTYVGFDETFKTTPSSPKQFRRDSLMTFQIVYKNVDKKLAIKRQFLRYIHPLKSITNAVDQKKCWIEQMKYLVQDFKTLLNLSFKEFWSTVVFNKQATMGLCTFLQESAPPHLMDQLPQDDDVLTIYNEIDHFAYKLFKRLTTSSENEENFMSPHYMWNLLYNNNIISIPMLYDICSIYGQSYKKELEIIFNELFTCQKLYKENLIHSIQFTIKCLSQFQDKIELEIDYGNHMSQSNKTSTEIEETNLCMIEDIINFLLDTSYSISNFLEIYPLASIFFYQEKLHLKIASFYHNIKPLIYKKVIAMNKLEKFQEKLHASRLLLVKSVKQCLIHIPTKTTNKSESAVEEYLGAVSELLAYNEFVNDYNVVYNLTKDIKKYQKSNKEIDLTRYDYLLKSLELINKPYTELEQKELQEQQLEVQTSSTNIENAKLRSLINNVKDLLPHLGDGFIQKCLEYYDMDSEKVINMVLEDCLPPELTQYEFNLPLMTEYEDTASGYDPSIKGNKKLKKLKAVLDDKSFRNEMRPFYEKYNFTEITCAELESYYNDEYDDTYDEVEYVIPEPTDENEKRRPDVIPRILIEKKAVTEFVEEEFSDDEPQQVLNFQPFCENPEEVRERQARRYAAKQSNRSNRSKPQAASSSATSSGSNVELDRQRKNENKAFSGNHNRRNAARNKQQRGMF